jgi:protein TonB
MEAKKTKKAAIENRRGSWLLMGAIVALAFMFVSFEWTQHDPKFAAMSSADESIFVTELPPITIPEEKPTPPPPQLSSPERLTIVPDTENVTTEVSIVPEDLETYTPVIPPPVIEDEVEEIEIRDFAEQMPEFPGGQSAMMKYLHGQIKYPSVSIETCSQGRVIVQFVVDKDGSIAQPAVIRGIDPYLDKEALRVVSSMPKWKAGQQNGKPVRVKYTIPVTFRLR